MNASKQPDLSIVIPAYAEEQRIGASLDRLARFLASDQYFAHLVVEVLVVAADAPDKTKSIVRSKQKLFHDLQLLEPGPRVGKGRDVQFGMLRARGRKVVFMDADLATPLWHLEEFYKRCGDGCDIVIGTRNLLTYRKEFGRGLFAWGGNLLYRLGSGIWVEDTQCGFKMFTAEAAEACFSRLKLLGWGFDIEILVIAKTHKLRVLPIRLNDWQHKPFSTYHEHVLRIASRSVREFVVVTWRRCRGSYR